MPLPAGTRFGPYEITSLIGAGGMGEVYRARDTKLDRDVAVKVLAGAFTQDPDRLTRFEREAKALASLNHPNIAHVYGLEDSAPGVRTAGPERALVMELVEGEDLAERIARGPLPFSDVIRIARQVAEAIAAAHEHGIVHRDLKPANIKVTPDGTVKVLDFGLAKTLDRAMQAAGAASAPTITTAGTLQGVVLGTAAYMSPEQARGLAVDARTDVWAFGCVIYELLVGRPAFLAPTASDTIAKILEHEPDWSALPSSTPPALRRVLGRCLEKDAKRRLHAIADTQFEIDEASADVTRGTHPTPTALGTRRWSIAVKAAAAAGVLAAVAWGVGTIRPPRPPSPRLLSLTSYPGIEAGASFSPDGTQVAFSWGGDHNDNDDIYVVMVGSDHPLPLTNDGARDVSPVWKSDGSQIAFVRLEAGRASIYLVTPHGAGEQRVAGFSAVARDGDGPIESADPGLSWSPDGRWLVISRVTSGKEAGVFLVSPADGSTRRLVSPSQATDDYRMAVFSPNGDTLAIINGGFLETVRIAATDPPSLADAPRRVTPFLGFVSGLAWSVDGAELVFGRAHYPAPDPPSLWRMPASGARPPERIDMAGVAGYPAISPRENRLAFARRGFNLDLFRLRDAGVPEPLLASTSNEQDPSFSPNGSQVAFATDRTGEGNEIWVAQTADPSSRRSVTKGAHKPEGSPRWSPAGDRLAFDGLGADGLRHVYLVDAAGGGIKPLLSNPGSDDRIPSWSRDGKWIYFGSDRTGRSEIWRAPAAGGEAAQVTTTGGACPFESTDGLTLYYSRLVGDVRHVFSMPVTGGPERQLPITVPFWNYVPGKNGLKNGLYYLTPRQGQRAPYTHEVRFFDAATGTHQLVYSVKLAFIAPGLSVLPDGITFLIAGATEITQDLMRIENFR